MIEIETHSAIIDFADILDKTEIVNDETQDAPWDNCDGYEHIVTPSSKFDDPHSQPGYAGNFVITIPESAIEQWGVYDYWRERGASKSVAREKELENVCRTLAQLVDWYRNGWEWWGVKCGYKGYHDSLWGIDNYEYAQKVRVEITGDVAYELEKKGYTVTGKPQPTKRKRFSHLHEQDYQVA
jgi:hypothetical protein